MVIQAIHNNRRIAAKRIAMWRKDQVWLHYVKNIIAADVPSALFLASYLKYISSNRKHVQFLEVFDLQKYKVIRQAPRVRIALKERMHLPFVFVAGKN